MNPYSEDSVDRPVRPNLEHGYSSQEYHHNEKMHPSPANPTKKHVLPTKLVDGKLKTKGIQQDGESGRSGFHPIHFLRVAWISSNTASKYLNILWPFVPAAIAAHFAIPDHHRIIFALCYVAMVPCANMLGAAGQELARKLPRVLGILIETTLGSVVEIVLFLVLVIKATDNPENIAVLQAAILGSIMTNLLFCLGFCFTVGGIANKGEQKFDAIISETGSGMLLMAAFALMIPSAFYATLYSQTAEQDPVSTYSRAALESDTKAISHGTAVILMVAFFIYIIYSGLSSHSVFDDVLGRDEEIDRDRHRDLAKPKFTMFEACLAIIISITLVSMVAVFLVIEIRYIVDEGHVPDAFLGFILVPLVEKLAEHMTAIDEAYDNQINFALYHCIGPSIQTALFNAPLAVIVGWALGTDMDLNFETFMIIVLVLTVIVVGNVLRDGASNYLEGSLLIISYTIIALATWYYPNPSILGSEVESGDTNEAARIMLKRLMQR